MSKQSEARALRPLDQERSMRRRRTYSCLAIARRHGSMFQKLTRRIAW
jgi:hypothetical protein